MNKILIVIFSSFWMGLSYGQDLPKLEGKFCSTQEGRLEYINIVSSGYFDWLLKKVERVPPDTEKYISTEYKDSLDTKNEVKYNNVVSNKFFFPWRLRESIGNFVIESKDGFQKVRFSGGIQMNPQESEMIFYTNLLEKYYDISEEFDTYRRFDRDRKPKVLNDQNETYIFTFKKGMYKRTIQDLIKCSFKK